jgi:hypothetical protein
VVAVVDNDVVYKCACYQLLLDVVESVNADPAFLGVLGTARFVASRRLKRPGIVKDSASSLKQLAEFFERVSILEPSDAEVDLAAELEIAAQLDGLALDAGESQLCAIAIERRIPLLLTGDKRAIEALERLILSEPRLEQVCGKVMCLEQILLQTLRLKEPKAIWSAVCNEQEIDKALTVAFGCSRPELSLEAVLEGLASYINAVRQLAPRILAS